MNKDEHLTLDANLFGSCFRFVNDLDDHNVGIKYIIHDGVWRLLYIAIKDIRGAA